MLTAICGDRESAGASLRPASPAALTATPSPSFRAAPQEFESNNFDLQGKYRDEGWVDDTPQGPSFWDKLFGKKDDSK